MFSPSLEFLGADLDAAIPQVLVALGLLSAPPAATPEDHADAKTLHGAISRAAAAVAGGGVPAARDVETLNSFALDEPPLPVLRHDGSVARTALDPLRAALAALARDAIDVIGRYGRDLRVCARGGCGLVFIGGSQAPRRRWCSMARCGNREKVAAFRNRVRGS